jgi:hypothetical protein
VTLPVFWIPEADANLKDSLGWYEGIYPGLGVRFALAVDATGWASDGFLTVCS